MTDELDDFERELAERPPPSARPRRRREGSAEPPDGRPRRWPFLLVGLVLGAAAALALPPLVSPHLPETFRPAGEEVSGVVAAKEREANRLLLTVRAEQGAILATFDRRVAEIDLLVDRGDTVTLGVDRYQPFVENPALRGVRKIDSPDAPARERPPAPPEEVRPEEVRPEEAPPADTLPDD